MVIYILGATIGLGLYLAWTIGANDFANSMSDAVGSNALSVRKAVILGGLCELAGSVLAGSSVTDTVRRGIVSPMQFESHPELLVVGMMCALLATAVWLHLASWAGMPVSTTHSIVGAVAGFGLVYVGAQGVQWKTLGSIVMSWIISPVAGFVLAYIIFKSISRLILQRDAPFRSAVAWGPVYAGLTIFVVSISVLYKGLDHFFQKHHIDFGGHRPWSVSTLLAVLSICITHAILRKLAAGAEKRSLADQLHQVERLFAPLVILTSCSVAFAHGANDVANAVGPVAAVVDIVRSGTIKMKVVVPFWILFLGGAGIVAGLATFGYQVMETVGSKLTQLTPSRGTAADIATMVSVMVCTRLKMPVSTTHTIVGAILGVGMARGLEAVNGRVFREILYSWFVTVPVAAILCAVLFVLARHSGLDEIVAAAFPR